MVFLHCSGVSSALVGWELTVWKVLESEERTREGREVEIINVPICSTSYLEND